MSDAHAISIAFQTDKPLADYGPLAARAEALGFDGVSAYNDLLFQPAWPALLEMARATRRVRLGPAAVNPFLTHPITIAGQLALLDEAAQGRAYLGLARGAWLDFAGLIPHRPVAALREALVAIRHLLRRNPDPLPGDHFPLAGGDTLRWAVPRAEVPFLLGSWGPRTIAACAPLVTEIKLGGSANPDLVRLWRERLGTGPDLVVGAVTVVDEDGAAARALARREVALYLPVVAALDPTLEIAPDRFAGLREAAGRFDFAAAAGFVSADLLSRFALAGTPTEVAEQAAALFDAGAARVEFGTPHGLTTARGLTLLGEQALPSCRAISRS